jgi:hypothetical protein
MHKNCLGAESVFAVKTIDGVIMPEVSCCCSTTGHEVEKGVSNGLQPPGTVVETVPVEKKCYSRHQNRSVLSLGKS